MRTTLENIIGNSIVEHLLYEGRVKSFGHTDNTTVSNIYIPFCIVVLHMLVYQGLSQVTS